MPFTLQDIAKFLINPLIPAFVILSIQMIRKRQSRRLLVVLFLYLYIVSIPLSSKILANVWSVNDTINYSKTYDAVVVLAGVSDPTWYLRKADNPSALNCYYRFGKQVDRFIAAIELLKTGHVHKLLFGDWRIKSFSEAKVVKEFLEKQGINPEQIVVCGEIRNTLDEAVKTHQYATEKGLHKLVMITSESHMRRAEAMFNKQGLYPDLLSVLNKNKKIVWKDFIPKIIGLRHTEMMLYEIVGYIGYRMLGKL